MLLTVPACTTSRLLKGREKLLYTQQIQCDESTHKRSLKAILAQSVQSTWLGMPLGLWVYALGDRCFDPNALQRRIEKIQARCALKAQTASSASMRQKWHDRGIRRVEKITRKLHQGNLFMRLGEAPKIYSDRKREQSEQNILRYLQARGYFDACVTSAVTTTDHTASVAYKVTEGPRYVLRQVETHTSDLAIDALIQSAQAKSLLHPGQGYSQDALVRERERLVNLFQHHGYFGISGRSVYFEVDKTSHKEAVSITTHVAPPAHSNTHARYELDRITWVVDQEASTALQRRDVSELEIAFKNLPKFLAAEQLQTEISLRRGQLYDKRCLRVAQARLQKLGLFKYVRVQCLPTGPEKLHVQIQTAPLDRLEMRHEAGLQVSQWLVSPFYSFSLTGRSLLQQLDICQLTAKVGMRAVSSVSETDRLLSSYFMALDASVRWPRLIGWRRATDALHALQRNPTTELTLGYHSILHPDYDRRTVESRFNYSWKPRPDLTFALTVLGLDITGVRNVHPFFEHKLCQLKTQGSNLYQSFNPAWVSMHRIKVVFSSKTAQHMRIIEGCAEVGGVLNPLLRLERWLPELEHHRYFKTDFTYRQHTHLSTSGRTVLAHRVGLGIAKPYSSCTRLPYDKYYFVGGGSCVRAWAPGTLGPGSYTDSMSIPESHRGEVLLRANVELRQGIYKALECALFADAGNTWMLTKDHRSAGLLSQDFYKEIAWGAGAGLRLNFTFLLLRLDLGLKLYDPSRAEQDRFVANKIALNRQFGMANQAVWSLGVGYPF